MYYRNNENFYSDNLDKRKAMVSIHCIAYNQEKYIRETLEGFVMQKTDFPFVAIVHDDASTDNTASIIREYADNYPDIIKPIFETENQYRKPGGSLQKIMQQAIDATGAKYIAYCEGDDYWTDPLKLQKQVDFLENNPDFTMCFNAIEVVNEHTGTTYPLAKVETREYSSSEIIESLLLQTASVVIRKDIYSSERYIKAKADNRFRSGDILLYLAAASIGRIYCIADFMSVYRINSGGVTNVMRKDPFIFVNEVKLMNEYFGDMFSRSFKNNLAKGYLRTLLIGVKSFRPNVIGKSMSGIFKNIWYLRPGSIRRSVYRKRRQ